MTVEEAQLELRKLGMVLSKTKYNEFRVNFKGGSEATAYYANDLGDAVGTGRSMSQQRSQGDGSDLGSSRNRLAADEGEIWKPTDVKEFYGNGYETSEPLRDIGAYPPSEKRRRFKENENEVRPQGDYENTVSLGTIIDKFKRNGLNLREVTVDNIMELFPLSRMHAEQVLADIRRRLMKGKKYGAESMTDSQGNRSASSRKVAADLRDHVAKAAEKYLDEAKAQGHGDDESSILEKLKESWPYLVASYLAKILKDVMTGKILDENRGTEFAASRNRMAQAGLTASKSARMEASQALDRISSHLEGLGQAIPREASNLRGIALRLDRVANTLEAEQEATDRVSKIESELDGLGVDFTVAPNSSDKQATCIFAYKGQLNSRDEASVLGRIAKKHGSTLENGNMAYKITVPHHV